MARGRTASPLGKGARKEKAFELFARGLTNAEVAREIQVGRDTAARYRAAYEADLQATVSQNPNMLRDILANTIRALRELDQVRAEAWKRYEETDVEATKATFLNTALKALDQRAKLFQLFGVKAEYMAQVAVIQRQQEKLIEFLGEHQFCESDRNAIVEFVASQISTTDLDAMSLTDEPSR